MEAEFSVFNSKFVFLGRNSHFSSRTSQVLLGGGILKTRDQIVIPEKNFWTGLMSPPNTTSKPRV